MAVAAGIDMFDCVLPTRCGRTALAYTFAGPVRLKNARHAADQRPLEEDCPCPACRHSRSYLRHLFLAGEMLGPILTSIHNLTFYQRLVARLRAAIVGRPAWRRRPARWSLAWQRGGAPAAAACGLTCVCGPRRTRPTCPPLASTTTFSGFPLPSRGPGSRFFPTALPMPTVPLEPRQCRAADRPSASPRRSRPGSPEPPLPFQLLPLVAIGVAAYLLLFRPGAGADPNGSRRCSRALKKNDRVVTSAGIYGTVAAVDRDADRVTLRVDESANVKTHRHPGKHRPRAPREGSGDVRIGQFLKPTSQASRASRRTMSPDTFENTSMNSQRSPFPSFAQAAATGDAAAAATAAPWWQIAGLRLADRAGGRRSRPRSGLAGRQGLQVPDMWGRLAAVLVALAAGGTICWLGWPPRLGIDLKGGLILVYEVAAGRQTQSRVDDCVAGIERILAAARRRATPPSSGGATGGLRVRLAAADAAAREAFLAADEAGVRSTA